MEAHEARLAQAEAEAAGTAREHRRQLAELQAKLDAAKDACTGWLAGCAG